MCKLSGEVFNPITGFKITFIYKFPLERSKFKNKVVFEAKSIKAIFLLQCFVFLALVCSCYLSIYEFIQENSKIKDKIVS